MDITSYQRNFSTPADEIVQSQMENPARLEISNFLTSFKLSRAGVTALLKLVKKLTDENHLDYVRQLPSSSRSFLQKRKLEELGSDDSEMEENSDFTQDGK